MNGWVLAGVFLIFFVGGPYLFRKLTGRPVTQRRFRLVAVFTAINALVGLGVRYGLPGVWGANVPVTVLAMACVWFAWVGILAYGAMALRRLDPGRGMRRWTGVIGAIGTTIPWFGLASAQMISG